MTRGTDRKTNIRIAVIVIVAVIAGLVALKLLI
jgi:hypothetical protein